MISDEDLMLSYVAGDIKAFETLYLKHKGPLYRYFRRQCKEQDKTEELFQDVWHKIIKAKNSYQRSAKFTTWIYHIAHNLLIDEYRKSSSVFQDNNEPTELASNIIDNLERIEIIEQLKLCLNNLSSVQLESFILKQDAGFDLIEISNIVNCDKETIKSRIRYAYSKLKICLNNKFGTAVYE
ncbi:hypothetical protein CJF42_13410 [Pseudoalteromonas sp. NBT06-2]|uniref:sigma-70 family RNA polymerase sigma factor n=1 Tax=Pseudoalteromonas sp. NBT06-2 TaxID=2025950 RepID=UPI000BA63E26|nr:sigma-70 family RNA polymerase sigma factor [Pseudoalteromonas sp. NBT06-2]PAJ73895.1 hypothetical protein CJF42_13410 [Pseudoalteromonas sp. NBT06-2]